MEIAIQTAYICFPSAGKSCPILKGNIMFNNTQYDVLKTIKETLKDKQFVDYSSVGFVLQKNELLVCDFEDFIHNRNLTAVKKRSIVLPFSLSFRSKEALCGEDSGKRVMIKAQKNAHVDKIIVRLASKDLTLLLKCVDHNQQKYAIYEKCGRFSSKRTPDANHRNQRHASVSV